MSQTPTHSSATLPQMKYQASVWWKNAYLWLVILLAAQYAIFKLLTGIEYGDGPRNLHWGLYLLEQPRFLIDVPDQYDRIHGFAPPSPDLAPRGKAGVTGQPLLGWWGPLYPMLFAGVWWLTGSYTLLQLVVPLAAGGTVLLTYAMARRYFSRQTALLAAALMALFPAFQRQASVSYVEPLSALLITAAFWSFLERRTVLTALFGSLAVLGKIDLIFIYFGAIVLTALLSRHDRDHPLPLRHIILSLLIPLLPLLPWFYVAYLQTGRSLTLGTKPSLEVFLVVAPMMLEQLFTIYWYGALLTLAAVLVPLWLALRRRPTAPPVVYRLLGIWLLLGFIVLLLYSAMPDASNNPRVLVPALPPVALLAAHGMTLLARRWRRRILFYLLTLFTLIAAIGAIFYQLPQARKIAATRPVWEHLRDQPRGFVLTEHYWPATLYAEQPATWFEDDPVFQRNILHSLEHFRRYVSENPIRYVVLPHQEADGQQRLTSPEVRAYLESNFSAQSAGEYVVFVLF